MAQAKARVRARVRAARTALSPKVRAERDAAVVAAVTTLVQDRGWSRVAGVCAHRRGSWGVIIGSGIGSLDDGVVVAGMSPRSDAAVGSVRWARVGMCGHVGDFGAAGRPARE